jgi:hypothetical protein
MEDERQNLEMKDHLKQEVLATDASDGHEKRLSRYSVAKTRQQKVVDYIIERKNAGDNLNLDKELKALQECGSFLIYRYYFIRDKYRLLAGCTCKKHLICTLCAIRRAAKCVAVYSEKITDVIQRGYNEGKEYDQLFITFTIKNGDNLLERQNHLQSSVKMLLQKRRNALKKNPKTDTLFKHVEGAIYSYEVTYSEENGFHPHVHMIAMVPKGIFSYTERQDKGKKPKTVKTPMTLWADLVENWKEITGDSHIIDIRLVESQEDQLSALVETFKYALKVSEMEVAIQVQCYQFLKGRRLLGCMGSLFGIKLPENLNDELLPEEEKYVDIVYQYSGATFGYQEVSRGGKNLPENFTEKVLKGTLYRDTPFEAPEGSLLMITPSPGGFGKLIREKLSDAPF